MNIDNEQLKAMSDKVAHVLGHKLHHLTRGQESSLNKALGSVFESHNGNVTTITDDEIWGAWNVMQAVYPDDVVELLEQYHPTR